tara:strand:- start:185 stop:814 length:630 start_codon:yes stop_codon:yes gene_type:complete
MVDTNFIHAQNFVNYERARDSESISGPGSSKANAKEAVELIGSTIDKYDIKSILDLGCGDWNWFEDIKLSNINYIGWDADAKMIASNKFYYPEGNIDFDVKDIVLEDYPSVDLIVCRDVLFHMSIRTALHALNKIKKSCKYLISTSFRDSDRNEGIKDEEWGYYSINLNITPFDLLKNEIKFKREMLGASPNGVILTPKRYICLYKMRE